MQRPFPLKRRSLRKSCVLIGNMVLADGLCGFYLLVRCFFLDIHVLDACLLIRVFFFQMEVVFAEYLLCMS